VVMQLYLLRLVAAQSDGGLDWETAPQGFSPYTDYNGHVVIAATEAQARQIAAGAGGSSPDAWWLDPGMTTCVEVPMVGPARILMSDTPTG
jgi:hypothetical protein